MWVKIVNRRMRVVLQINAQMQHMGCAWALQNSSLFYAKL